MSAHPIFLIVRAKLADLQGALDHMSKVHAQQMSVKQSHPDLYAEDVHAESLATNIQGIYTQMESILKRLADNVDGFSPAGETWHRDLLLQLAADSEHRPHVISSRTIEVLSELLAFRHAVRHNYADRLRPEDVFRNMAALSQTGSDFVAEIEQFAHLLGSTPAPSSSPLPDRV